MLRLKHTTILLILAVIFAACNQTKFVPEGKHLLKKNEVVQLDEKLPKEDLFYVIRQQPNYRTLGVPWKLYAFNAVDSAKVADKRIRKNEELRVKNRERLAKEDRINAKRIEKAQRKGRSYYTHKTIPLKDTIEPRMFLKEWYKYKIGRPPVVFDSIPFNKSLEQFRNYYKSRGYYYSEVNGIVEYKDNGKCIVKYLLNSGPRYKIDSVYYEIENAEVKAAYEAFLKIQHDPPLLNEPFDSEMLDDYRDEVTTFMRDSSFYGFGASSITFLADTNRSDMSVKIGVRIGDRLVRLKNERDSVIAVPHRKVKIDDVYFHIADTNRFEGNFKDSIERLGLTLHIGPFLRTIDTLYYDSREGKSDKASKSRREAIVTYNGDLIIRPRVLEIYNYLDKDGPYRERFVESSYRGMLRLGMFTGIRTELVETEDSSRIEAHHYLVPGKRQSIGFEPKATNSNGFLGVSASFNYTNRNLFHGAERLTISLSGGFESQPPIFDETVEGEKIKTAGRSFNTFEFGPSVKLEIPGFFPFRTTNVARGLRPTTIVSTAYNYQSRSDFARVTYQMNYLWKFIASKTSIFQVGLPGLSTLKWVYIDPDPAFTQKLEDLNDLFLLNAYSNQFIWQDWSLSYEYNIKDKPNRKSNTQLVYSTRLDPSGNLLSLFKGSQDTLENGQHALYGLAYAQFIRWDNEVIFSKPFRKERSVNLRLIAGGGLPYGNSTSSMPYDYSFFGGGANDNRGWRARSLGPGVYKQHLDTTRTATQLGDVRLGGSAEARFPITSLFKGAVFLDAGNVWTLYDDEQRPGGQFTTEWYQQLALATGIGVRLDFEYFIIRVDLGVPLRNPTYPKESQWVWQKKTAYYDEIDAEHGYIPTSTPRPFTPQLHFGIGYPF